MVTFLLGKLGHGKSSYISDKIKKDCEKNIRSLLIVPEQQTVLCEKEIASSLPPKAQLFTEALNFTRLSNKIFREYGGLKYNYITKSGQSLIMYQAICETRDFLKEYKIPKGREKSLVTLFLHTIAELKSYGVSPKQLEDVAGQSDNENLNARLFDIANVYSAYENILSEKFSDPYDDILMLAKKLSEINCFKGYNIYIDSFYGFTKSQEDVIYHIMRQAENVTFAFDCPGDCNEQSLQYAKIAGTYEKIKSIARKLGKEFEVIPFPVDYKHKNDTLKYICDNIWNFSSKKVPYSDGIYLTVAENEFDEADYVSSKIKSLISNGAKYSDIAIISRNIDTYSGIIDVSLSKFDIPYFMSKKTDITSKPVIKMIFSAIRAVTSYRIEDVISYLKCGYSDIDESDIDEFENYIYKWNIYGNKFKNDDFWLSNPDGYVMSFTDAQRERLIKITDTKNAVLSKLSTLDKAFFKGATVRDISSSVFEFLCEHKVKEKLEEEIRYASKEDAYEISQIWNITIKALDTLVDIMGGISSDAATYETLLKYTLDNESIGTIPTGEDNVTVGDASMIRVGDIKYVFVMGVNEGSFPQNILDDGFFSDSDKVTLETYGITLSYKKDVRADDELMFFKNSIACASHAAFVSCVKNDLGGNAKQPSIAFTRIKNLFSDPVITDTSLIKIEDYIYSERNAKEYFSLLPDTSRNIITDLTGYKKGAVRSFSNEDSSINKDFAKDLFGQKLNLTQSRIEAFVNCKFKYYCSYLLGLKSDKEYSFNSANVGNMSHKIFEMFLSEIKKRKTDLSKMSDEDIESISNGIINSYISSVSSSSTSKTKHLNYIFGRIRKNLLIYLKNIVEELAQSDFSPEYFELSFSGDGTDSPLPLNFKAGEDSCISIYGVADRVDVLKKDSNTYVRIIDYKSGSKTFSRADARLGLGIQLLIYLFTFCKMKNCNFKEKLSGKDGKILPAGILYFPLNIGKSKIDKDIDLNSPEAEEAEKEAIAENIKRNGILLDNEDILKAQDKENSGKFIPKYPSRSKGVFISEEEFENIYTELEETIGKIGCEILSGDAKAEPLTRGDITPCDYCEHRSVCRRRAR